MSMQRCKRFTAIFLMLGIILSKLPAGMMVAVAATPRTAAIYRSGTGYFGDGSDGDLVIKAGQTVTLPVPNPHITVVEKHYRNVTIEAGGVLKLSDFNAGLVIRATGDVDIKGTIDQSLKAPKINPSSTYAYPPELVCGNGGAGGNGGIENGSTSVAVPGGKPMTARPYGGGYGGGGGGGNRYLNSGSYGGDADKITIDVPQIFIGGIAGRASGDTIFNKPGNGQYGGGGGGQADNDRDDDYSWDSGNGGAGGSGPSGNGDNGQYGGSYVYTGSGGGAGNFGGGVVLLYVKGKLTVSGTIDCSGGKGGNAGDYNSGSGTNSGGSGGGGGGGGGGGAVYIEYGSSVPVVTNGAINTAGGQGGLKSTYGKGVAGGKGTSGSVTTKRAPDAAPPTVVSVTVSSGWAATNTATITATDNMTGVVSYAVTTSSSTVPTGSWQSGSSFTLSANGTYYAWARDAVGNISSGYAFTVSKVDTAAPVIDKVTVTPTGWSTQAAKLITVLTSDAGSGVAQYGISTTATAPTAWQAGNTFTKAAGTYYLWAKDNAGNISANKQVVVDQIDTAKPTINTVTVSTAWADRNTATVSAADTGGSGLKDYAYTVTNAAPSSGWQTSNSFTISANGSYYAWVRDTAGNVSAGKTFTVSKVDDIAPVISEVVVTPAGWTTAAVKTITISATDAGSGVKEYGITSSTTAPAGWQTGNTFTKAAGTYYVWAKDAAGNVSLSKQVVVDSIDTSKPVISSVTVPTAWAVSSTVTVNATDAGGSRLKDYAVTTSSFAPSSGWQVSSSFTQTANGTYYAWARDAAGNVSEGFRFVVDKADAAVPVINSVTVTPSGWTTSATKTITVLATDGLSGVSGYGITTNTAAPTSWQADNFFSRAAGTYYVWAKDTAGNVSVYKQVIVDQIDTGLPAISSITVPTAWGAANTVTINAADTGGSGIKDYAVTTTTVAPSAWQAASSFTLASNGTLYAWVRDTAGNISAPKSFVVSKVDTLGPTISNATVTPTGWVTSTNKTITVTASDGQSGIAGYGITSSTAAPSGWQTENTFVKPAGTYYLWAKDAVGNISAYKQVVIDGIDTTKPNVSSVTVPTTWGMSSTVTVNATDAGGSELKDFAVTTGNAVPTTGWKTDSRFTLTANGSYYAWARDTAGNISSGFSFSVSKVDTTAPTIDEAAVTPTGWSAAATKTITVTASDGESGVAQVGITTDTTTPASWQTAKTFSRAAGTYYVWAKDAAGNVSAGRKVVVDGIDTAKPTVSGVTVSSAWATANTATIKATDTGGSGLKVYAITATNTAPATGWQTGDSFTLSANGDYCAWARDAAGNISAGYAFKVSKVDDVIPVVTGAVVTPAGWISLGTKTITVTATDVGCGVKEFGITTNTAAPTDWQAGNTFTKAAGTYFVWAKDAAGNISVNKQVVVDGIDTAKPTISSVTVSTAWADSSTVTVNASDTGGSGLKDYAYTTANTAPSSGWQTDGSFSISGNGSYYAWARDAAGNISVGKTFTVSRVDDIAPVISEAVVTPTGWSAAATKTITVTASDGESGVAQVGITTDTTTPASWQTAKTFSRAAGTYYVWAKDAVGNVSAGKQVVVDKIDTAKPIVSGVSVSAEWAKTNTASVRAADTGGSGLMEYAVTTGNTAPATGWQTGDSFTLSANGDYYAWARDTAGNVSAGYAFKVSRVDDVIPVVTGAVVTPAGWISLGTKTITVTATDVGCGVKEFGITTNTAAPTDWQAGNTFTKAAGTYFVWAKDAAGNISVNKQVVVDGIDTAKPTISSVTVSTAWADSSTVTVNASDTGGSGLKDYAYTTANTAPSSGWQTDGSFNISGNGSYYAWARDAAGNVSVGKAFVVSRIDDIAPSISEAAVTPTGWSAAATKTITVTASDGESGVTQYGITTNTTAPTAWQTAKTFSKPAGTYYVWAKDAVGNVSAGKQVVVDKIDTAKPIVSGVSVSAEWAKTNTASVRAADTGGSGLKEYAVTTGNTAPSTGWQTGDSFTLSANGDYYAWARDAAGNLSVPKKVTVDGIDAEKPIISGVAIPDKWSGESLVTVKATDAGSGIKEYAVTLANEAPATGWQTTPDFKLTANGTYYAWARDLAGNVSSSFQFTISKVDAGKPVIQAVQITPEGWTADATKKIAVTAADDQSSITGYGITSSTTPPSEWQTENTFVKPAGTYYLWVRDAAGNNSAYKQVTVSGIDQNKPSVNTVTVSGAWAPTNTATINAVDMGGSGLAEYAVTAGEADAATVWQSSKSFIMAANGSYYAWSKDAAGNISSGYAFTVSKVDATAPVVTAAEVTDIWGTSGKVKVTAADTGSGLKDYAVTVEDAAPAEGWQSSGSFTLTGNGVHYAWARDAAGNVSKGFRFTVSTVDTTAPEISGVEIPETWGNTATIKINASDTGGGAAAYAVSGTDKLPVIGWQASDSFTLSSNGDYYAWARDAAGNVSASFAFSVSRVDVTAPAISGVELPGSWVTSGVVKINATDVGSGITAYAVSSGSTAPAEGWQSSGSFTLTGNGIWYAWARDAVGNVSRGYMFQVTKMDVAAPVVSSVDVPTSWATSSTVKINATDTGSGITGYAVTAEDKSPVTGWQPTSGFTLQANGTWYAWTRDAAGNISKGFRFQVSRIDTEPPEITAAEAPDDWSGSSMLSVTAADAGSGVAAYALTGEDTPPTAGWQNSGSFAVTLNGIYYAWARDTAGNVSKAFEVAVVRVDTDKPTISKVTCPTEWCIAAGVEIEAADAGSAVKEYAVSSHSYAPSGGWQASPRFDLSKNGDYFAFARDLAGNVSEGYSFTLDKVDTDKPTVTTVQLPLNWSSTAEIKLETGDVGSGLKEYAVTVDATPPAEGWQNTPDFTLVKNGSYYGWARDGVGNVSAGRSFSITRVDKTPPAIDSVAYSSDNSVVMVRGKDSESGVKGIWLDGELYEGANVSCDLEAGAKHISIQVEDFAGHRSEEKTERVPGWYDQLDALSIEPVEFINNNQAAIVKAVSKGSAVAGIYINGKLFYGNPITHSLSAGTEYLELQAQDVHGDRSVVYRVRVPGWAAEVKTLSIVDVRFASDNSMVQVTATETAGRGVRGIRVNGELLPGNPVQYTIPEGTRHLELQAEDNEGDRSAVLIRRVPGWSEIVTTLTVTDIAFLDYNTTVQVTATATGGDTVAGIEINGQLLEGNPVIWKIPKDTELLKIQAVDPAGDRSPMVTKQVPVDASKSTLKLYIEEPAWTSGRKAQVKITAEDNNRIVKILARTADEKEWADITEQRYIYVTADTTVYASVENEKGEIREASQSVECFDRSAPQVTATQDGNVINIRAIDDKSGVASILVNNKEFKGDDIFDGLLAYPIPAGTVKVTIFAEDEAGNLSRAVELPLQTTVTAMPVIVAPTPEPPPPPSEPEEVAVPEPESKPAPESVTEAPSSPEPEPEPAPAEAEPQSRAGQVAATVGGVGTTTLGGIWYWFRRMKLSKPVEELMLAGKKLLYDESEYGGPIDPLDMNK